VSTINIPWESDRPDKKYLLKKFRLSKKSQSLMSYGLNILMRSNNHNKDKKFLAAVRCTLCIERDRDGVRGKVRGWGSAFHTFSTHGISGV
jgi:hypothetical protein